MVVRTAAEKVKAALEEERGVDIPRSDPSKGVEGAGHCHRHRGGRIGLGLGYGTGTGTGRCKEKKGAGAGEAGDKRKHRTLRYWYIRE